jgi:hypothetical protein
MLAALRERLGHWLLRLQPDEVQTVRQLTAEFAQIRLEWADTLDFIQHWAGRQAKRDAKVLKQLQREPEEPPPSQTNGEGHGLAKSQLRALAASRRIVGRQP